MDLGTVNACLLWRQNNEAQYMPLYDFKLAISGHIRLSQKVITNKRGPPSSLLGTPTSSYRGDSPISLPTSQVTHKKVRKTPARHQDFPLNSVRTYKVDPLEIGA
ncbi:hypothetical protein HHI36_017467 [Cryptolaemus montrouzieri]|uniref:Uncharacterized protein n=1 Tax=Cryptolaemus montrouzieri TaxID=559131 RepID=A0ABD2NNE6_9CUCU